MKHAKEKEKKKLGIILILILLLGGGYWIWKQTSTGLGLDPNQSEGSLEGLSRAEIDKLMQDKVEEGNFMISIHTQPVFENGRSAGTLRIENNPKNRYLMVVKIFLKENGKQTEKIYESGAIKPGNKIEKAKLDVELKKGKYPVIAYFEAYDQETKDYVGKAASELTVFVKN